MSRLRDGSLLGAFGRDVAYLSSGAAAAQVVLLLSQVALARLYTPAERGAFSVAIAYASILAVFATMRYEMAIPLAERDAEARGLLRLCLWSSVGVGLGVQVVLALVALLRTGSFAGWTSGLGDGLGAGAGMWFVPVTAVATSLFTTLRLFESRRGRFGAVGRASVWGALVTGAAQIGAGLAGLTAVGLTLGYAAGRLANALGMSTRAADLGGPREPAAVVARRWRRMPLLNSLPALLNVVSVGAVAPLVALLYGREFTGQFGLATQVLAAPAALLGQAVASVFYPRVARLERESADARSAVLQAATGLVVVALPVFVAVGVLGPEVFGWLFGSRWYEAGVFAALLAPWLGTNFVSSPLNSYATVRDRLGRIMVIAVVETALRVGGLWMGVALGRPVLGVAFYGVAGAVICTYFVAWVLRLAGSSLAELLAAVRLPGLVATATVVASLTARSWGPTAMVVTVGVVGSVAVAALAGGQALRLVRSARTSS